MVEIGGKMVEYYINIIDKQGQLCYNTVKGGKVMEYIVKIRLKGKGGKVVLEWPEEKVEGENKWDALVRVSEKLGVAQKVTMSELWKGSKIRQAERKDLSKRRVKE